MKGNILIVDDEILLLERLESLLSEYADNIYVAVNGIEALKILETNEVHCIVCDINMPQMNGVQFLKKIREDKVETPFIFYTGHGNKDLMMEAAKYGALDFLDKPLLDGLEEVVMRGLQIGTKTLVSSTITDGHFLSDYTRLLNEIDKKKCD